MKLILILTALSLLVLTQVTYSDSKEDEKIIVSCRGTVAEYSKNAVWIRIHGKPCITRDIAYIQIDSPEEWKGHVLEVHCEAIGKDHPIAQKGKSLKFDIARDYLIRKYENDDGTYDEHIAGNGAITIK